MAEPIENEILGADDDRSQDRPNQDEEQMSLPRHLAAKWSGPIKTLSSHVLPIVLCGERTGNASVLKGQPALGSDGLRPSRVAARNRHQPLIERSASAILHRTGRKAIALTKKRPACGDGSFSCSPCFSGPSTTRLGSWGAVSSNGSTADLRHHNHRRGRNDVR